MCEVYRSEGIAWTIESVHACRALVHDDADCITYAASHDSMALLRCVACYLSFVVPVSSAYSLQ